MASPAASTLVYGHELPVYEEEQAEEYPVHIFLSREGYFKKISPQSLRMSSDQKFKEGDSLRQSFETTSNAEIMFFTDQHQVYKTRLSEFEDSKASVLGEYLPAKLGMDPGESVIYAVAAGSRLWPVRCCSSLKTAKWPGWSSRPIRPPPTAASLPAPIPTRRPFAASGEWTKKGSWRCTLRSPAV